MHLVENEPNVYMRTHSVQTGRAMESSMYLVKKRLSENEKRKHNVQKRRIMEKRRNSTRLPWRWKAQSGEKTGEYADKSAPAGDAHRASLRAFFWAVD